jgi:hypothetical protein
MQRTSVPASVTTTASESDNPKNAEGHIVVTESDIAASSLNQASSNTFTPYFAQMSAAPIKFNKIEVPENDYIKSFSSLIEER